MDFFPIAKGIFWLVLVVALEPAHGRGFEALQESIRSRVELDLLQSVLVAHVSESGTRIFGAGSVTNEVQQPPTADTLYEIGEVTGVFTTLALSFMDSQRRMSWNSRAATLLPVETGLSDAENPILLRHLASHSANLPHLPPNLRPSDPQNPFIDYGEKDLTVLLSEFARFSNEPGSEYRFSAVGMGVLGHVLSLRHGATYEQMIQDVVLKPLGMEDTTAFPTLDQSERTAPPHEGETPVSTWDFDVLAGYASLRTSIRDLVRFLRVYLEMERSPYLPQLRKLLTPVLPTSDEATWVAYGWHVTSRGGYQLFWHSGQTGGSAAFIAINPHDRVGVALLGNSSNRLDDLGFHLIAPDVFPLNPMPRYANLGENELEHFTGTYRTENGGSLVKVRREGRKLYVQIDSAPDYRVYPVGPTTFIYAKGPTRIKFEKGSGRSPGLVLLLGQKVATALRVPDDNS